MTIIPPRQCVKHSNLLTSTILRSIQQSTITHNHVPYDHATYTTLTNNNTSIHNTLHINTLHINTLQHQQQHNRYLASSAASKRQQSQTSSKKAVAKKTAKKQPFRLDKQNSNKEVITWSIQNAIPLIVSCSHISYDESIEIHLNLNLDPRKPNQTIRGVCALPHGTGKKVRIAVFARNGDKINEARQAGADIVGNDDLINNIMNGQIDFDRCIATPDMMASVGKIARILGPRGLMPNPKLGTVTNDITQAIKQSKQGSIQYKTDRFGIIHCSVGKVSFNSNHIVDNINTIVQAVLKDKPSGAKGTLLKSAFLSSTMGVSVPLDITQSPFTQKIQRIVAT